MFEAALLVRSPHDGPILGGMMSALIPIRFREPAGRLGDDSP